MRFDEHAVQLRLVAAHVPHDRLHGRVDPTLGHRRRLVHHPSHETFEIDFVDANRRRRLLGRRHQEQLFDQAAQALAVVDGAVEQLRPALVVQPAAQPADRLDGPDDRRHRRAELVRDRRHELTLLAVQVELLAVRLVDFLVQAGVGNREIGLRREAIRASPTGGSRRSTGGARDRRRGSRASLKPRSRRPRPACAPAATPTGRARADR